MEIKAILFDVNSTMVKISTDEEMPDIYRKIRNFLAYQGIFIHKSELYNLYYQIMKEQKDALNNKLAEYDAVAIWRRIIELKQTDYTRNLPACMLESLPMVLAQMHRSASLCDKLQTYPEVHNVLDKLYTMYPLGIVTDAQTAYASPELNQCGLAKYFNPIIISGDYGFRKPNSRLFKMAIDHFQVDPANMIFVGNDMYHDVTGAKQAGMKSIYFASGIGETKSSGYEPDYIVRQFSEIPAAIEFIRTNL